MVSFEQLPLEVIERCLRALPSKSLAVMLQLSRKTRALVLKSIEMSFLGLLSAYQKWEQYLTLEVVRASPYVVKGKSPLRFSHFVPALAPPSVQQPLQYARFEIDRPIDLNLADPYRVFIFGCSLSYIDRSNDPSIISRIRYPHQDGFVNELNEIAGDMVTLFEDLCEVDPDRPIIVEEEGLIVYTERIEEAVLRLDMVDFHPLKVLEMYKIWASKPVRPME